MKLPKNSEIIFEAIVGSQSYNLHTPESDVDIKGVFVQDISDILSNRYVPQVDVDKDTVYYELRRFLELVSTGNPNVLELLFTPEKCILKTSKKWNLIKELRKEFITKRCYNTFSGYAKTQLKKASGLNKKYNWEKDRVRRRDVLDFCKVIDREIGETFLVKDWLENNDYNQSHVGLSHITGFRDCYRMYLDDIKATSDNPRFKGEISENRGYRGIADENTNEPRKSVIEKYRRNDWKCILYFNRESYSTHCKEYREYSKWLKNRNENRVATNKKNGQQIDGKNILHLVRLIMTGMEIPIENIVNVDRTKDREYLLSIKRGKVDLKDIIKEWGQKAEDMKGLYDKSMLKDEVDKEFVSNLELKIRKL